MSQIARLLIEAAKNSADARRESGALWGQTVAQLSNVPAQVMTQRAAQADRESMRQLQAANLGVAQQREAREASDAADTHALRVQQLEAMRRAQAGDEAAKLIAQGAGPEETAAWIKERTGKLWTPEESSALLTKVQTPESASQFLSFLAPTPKPEQAPKTREIRTTTPEGGETIQIVEDKPGQTFASAPKPVVEKPEKAPAAGTPADYLARTAKELGKNVDDLTTAEVDRALKKHTDATQKAPMLGGMNALYSATDPKAIAAAIRAGTHPPDISQYGRPVSAAVASELAKAGPNGEKPFNLAGAQREFKAQLNLNRTMNGAQQVRLDESIRSGLAMYDKIDDLAEQWGSLGVGPLSRLNLKAAQEGLKGSAAQSLANQLTGQIGQLTSDVATIEQGGLTPTNEARAVAEKSLQDWWGKGTIKDMTQQGRWNMQARHLARQTQEPMVPGNNPSTAPAQPATPAIKEPPVKEGVINGKPVVWKTVNGISGWYAK